MAYPTTVTAFTTIDCNTTTTPADVVNAIQDDLEAVETKLGTGASTPTNTMLLRGTGVGSSAWDKAAPSGDIVGTTDTQTLTNKTLTAPRINSPQVNEAVTMSSTSTELNFLDGSIAGTSVASKSLVLGASKNTDVLTIDNALKFNSPQGYLVNGQFLVSVGSNNLTIALKTLAGTDASSDNPIHIRIGNSVRTVVAALSLTLNAGINYFSSGSTGKATNAVDYFIFLGWRASDSSVFIGFAGFPCATTYNDFSATNTNSRYLAFSGASPASSDEVSNVGRFTATLGATASFNWSISGTASVINEPTYYTEWRTYVSQTSVSGGTAPTYTNTDTGIYQIAFRTCQYLMSKVNTAGGTAGSGGAAILFTLPIAATSTITAPVGVTQWFNNASGEVSRSKINTVNDFLAVRSTTANLVGNDQNNATRIVESQVIYPV